MIERSIRLLTRKSGCSLFALSLLWLTAAAPASESVAPTAYRLGVGDLVRIQVYREEDLAREVRVSAAGTVSFPLIGELTVAGLTTTELERLVTRRLKGDFLTDPKVNVNVLEYRPFFINGEVEKPGAFPYQPGLTVRKAVSIAGGLKERASLKKISVIRARDRGQTLIRVDLDTAVEPGDVITIDKSFF